MPAMWWVVSVVTLVVLVATYLTWTAARVDRLHERASAAQSALDAHLVRRAAAAATLGDLAQDHKLRGVARAALDAQPQEREAAENDLTRVLRQLPATVDAHSAAFADVVATSRRVALARQLYNDVVRDALAVRRGSAVRLLGLARRHPSPAYFDIDDPGLG
jgi:hypothetical protein